MLESYIFRTMAEWEASKMDFLIVLAVFVVIAAFWFLHSRQAKEIERITVDYKRQCELLWEKTNKNGERYHRHDALLFAQTKVLQLKTTGRVSLISESADGDGDYTLDRSHD